MPKTDFFEIKQLDKNDVPKFKQLIALFNDIFGEDSQESGNKYLEQLLANANFIAMAAILGTETIGGLTAYELPLYREEQSEWLLYDLGVAENYKRLGIGKRLVESLKAHCSTNGIKEFFVLAHEEDEGAIEFYRSTGGRGERVVNFIYNTGS